MTTPKTIAGGLVVLFEGLDGVGKTTQLEMAKTALSSDGWLVETARVHGGTPICEQLRQVSLSNVPRPPMTDVYISLAMHAALIEQLQTYREQGAIILLDRGPLSLVAYQLFGSALLDSLGWNLADDSVRQFAADLTLLYDASVEIALERAKQKSGASLDYFESKPTDYFEAVRHGFLTAGKRYHALVVNAEQPQSTVYGDTAQAILRLIDSKAVNA